jgi:hypothetical protein
MIMMPYNCSSHRYSSQAVRTSGTLQALSERWCYIVGQDIGNYVH